MHDLTHVDPHRLSDLCAAIVTGSSSGIGRGIALALAAAGVKLVICADLTPKPVSAEDATADSDRGEEERATHELITTRYGEARAVFMRCDVGIERAKEREGMEVGAQVWGMADVVAEAVRRAKRLDLAVNATGTFLGSKHAIAQFLQQEPDAHGFRGNVINVASIGGFVGLMRCGAYCASKAAIIGLSRAAALEYADRGIRCNVVCPGYIATPMLAPELARSPAFGQYLDAMIPLQRLGRPSDVAGAAVWLAAGSESGYITGVVLPIDGGFTTR
ncbi:hypothetical protein MMC11_008604 [Xylographa trunciseda]|nr:hypothetical protein [Xylographa trunciseda]